MEISTQKPQALVLGLRLNFILWMLKALKPFGKPRYTLQKQDASDAGDDVGDGNQKLFPWDRYHSDAGRCSDGIDKGG